MISLIYSFSSLQTELYLLSIYCKCVLMMGLYHACVSRLAGEVKGEDLILTCQGMF